MRNRSLPQSPSPTHNHTFCETLLEDTIAAGEPLILKWDLQGASAATYTRISYLFRDSPAEAKQFIDGVNDLQRAMNFAAKQCARSDLLVRAHNLMQSAMNRLQKEFHTILSGNRYFLDSGTVSARSSRASTRSTVSDSEEDLPAEDGEAAVEKVSDAVVADLKAIATCMIGAGYGMECVKIYNGIRKSVTDETLYYLGVEKLTISQIQKMDWEVMEKKILNYQSAMRIAVKTLFLGERILCDEVFSASDHIRESCFSEISKDAAISLFNFIEAAAKYKKVSIEKVFRYLDLYEAFTELWPEIESIFSIESTTAVKSQAAAAVTKIGDAVRAMLMEFEEAVQKDSSKPPLNGGVHPLTRYVMNFLVFMADFSATISDIIGDFPLTAQSRMPETYFSSPSSNGDGDGDGNTTVSAFFAWLVFVLLCKLDNKARQYKDSPLSYLFLANNLNYVVSKVQNSNLSLVLGPDWISKQEAKVRKFISNYETIAWSEVLTSLTENPESNDVLTRFISVFEDTCRKQVEWVIPDAELRDRVKISIARKIVPGYRVVYERCMQELYGKGPKVRFAPDDLHNYISDLFHGRSDSSSTTSYRSRSPLHGR